MSSGSASYSMCWPLATSSTGNGRRAHLNAKMPLKTRCGPLKLRRRTWTLYLDYRVFAANYAVRNNAGFEQ